MSNNKGSWLPESIEEAVINDGLEMSHVWLVSKAVSYHEAGETFYASNAYLGKKLGKVPRTVQRLIESLIDRNWLARQLETSSRGTDRALIPSSKTLSILRGDIDVMPRGDTDVMGGVTPATPNNKGHNKVSNNKDLPLQQSKDSCEVLRDFEKHSLEKEPKYFIDQLEESHYPLCVVAMEELKELKASWQNIYCGSQTIEDWMNCEDTLREITTSDEACDYDELDAVALFVRTTYLKRCTQRTSPIGLKFITALVNKIGVTYSLSVDYADLLGTDTEE